jgi:hypothetical protein
MRDEDVKPKVSPMPRLEQVLCRRTGRDLPIEEHQHCSYCYGRAQDIANGQYTRFCDFVPGRDPIHFGFPEGTSRDLEG